MCLLSSVVLEPGSAGIEIIKITGNWVFAHLSCWPLTFPCWFSVPFNSIIQTFIASNCSQVIFHLNPLIQLLALDSFASGILIIQNIPCERHSILVVIQYIPSSSVAKTFASVCQPVAQTVTRPVAGRPPDRLALTISDPAPAPFPHLFSLCRPPRGRYRNNGNCQYKGHFYRAIIHSRSLTEDTHVPHRLGPVFVANAFGRQSVEGCAVRPRFHPRSARQLVRLEQVRHLVLPYMEKSR